jgi:AraC family transcriptional regulator
MNIGSVSHNESPPSGMLFDRGSRRHTTVALHSLAVKRATLMIQECFKDDLTLHDLACTAQLSRFHFSRVFRSITGLSPSSFLEVVRLEQAKKMLLKSTCSVIDVCFDIGYQSVGTFTSRFSQFVGIAPTGLRQLARKPIMQAQPGELLIALRSTSPQPYLSPKSGSGIVGTIEMTIPFRGIVYVGAFADPLPRGRSLGHTFLTGPGPFQIDSLPDGAYYLLVAALGNGQNLLNILQQSVVLHGGLGKGPVLVSKGTVPKPVHIRLSPTSCTDPPLLNIEPFIAISQLHLS